MNSQWQRERQAVCIIVWGVCLCITIRDLSWRERWLTDTVSSVWTVGLRGRTADGDRRTQSLVVSQQESVSDRWPGSGVCHQPGNSSSDSGRAVDALGSRSCHQLVGAERSLSPRDTAAWEKPTPRDIAVFMHRALSTFTGSPANLS